MCACIFFNLPSSSLGNGFIWQDRCVIGISDWVTRSQFLGCLLCFRKIEWSLILGHFCFSVLGSAHVNCQISGFYQRIRPYHHRRIATTVVPLRATTQVVASTRRHTQPLLHIRRLSISNKVQAEGVRPVSEESRCHYRHQLPRPHLPDFTIRHSNSSSNRLVYSNNTAKWMRWHQLWPVHRQQPKRSAGSRKARWENVSRHIRPNYL